MAFGSRLLLSLKQSVLYSTRHGGSNLGKCQAELWKRCLQAPRQTRCLSLSLTMKGERSDGEEQPLFSIDDETMNIISPKLKDADPRDVPLMNFGQDSLPSSATPPSSQKAPHPQDGTLPVVRMRIKDQWYQKLPIVHIKATFNNTIFTITDPTGKVLAWTSSGMVGFKNARRGTTFAAQSAAMTAAQKVRELGFQKVQVKIKGPGPGRQPSIKGLEGGGLQIISIQDVTPVPHNGCRPRKARRL